METSSQSREEAVPSPTDGLFGEIAKTFNSVRRVAFDTFQLVSVEVRRAGVTLMWMVALGATAAILVVTAWLSLVGALALWVVSLGVPWAVALLAISLVNLLVAAAGVFACIAMSRDLLFPATRRQLKVSPEVSPAGGAA